MRRVVDVRGMASTDSAHSPASDQRPWLSSRRAGYARRSRRNNSSPRSLQKPMPDPEYLRAMESRRPSTAPVGQQSERASYLLGEARMPSALEALL